MTLSSPAVVRISAARLARAARSVVPRRPVRHDLEHERAVVADLLHRRQRRRPVDASRRTAPGARRRARGCRARASRSGAPSTVSIASTHVAVEVRVAEIEADAHVDVLEIVLDEVHERPGARQLVGDDLHGDPHAERLRGRQELLDAAPRRRACRRPRRPLCVRGTPRCTTSTDTGIRRAMYSACSASRDRVRPGVGVGAGERQRPAPASAREAFAIGAWMPCSSARLPRATAAGPRPRSGCDSRNACASRTPRPSSNPCAAISSRCSRHSRWRGRGASRSRTVVWPRAETSIVAISSTRKPEAQRHKASAVPRREPRGSREAARSAGTSPGCCAT